MNLAEAIRQGSAISKQAYCVYVVGNWQPRQGEPAFLACALGAAALAIGRPSLENERDTPELAFAEHWPELLDVSYGCPIEECGIHEVFTLFRLIAHLNDTHEWKREKIADWIDEQVLDLAPVTVAVEART